MACNISLGPCPPELTRYVSSLSFPTEATVAHAFQSDEEYMHHAHAILAIRNFVVSNSAAKDARQLLERAEGAMLLRCAASAERGHLPRLERVASKLGLSPSETHALQFIVLHNLGAEFDDSSIEYAARALSTNLQRCAGLTPRELLDFVDPSRTHMEQGLVEVDEGFEGTFRGQNYKMPREALAALLGGRLAPDEFLKIDNTALAEVLQEDGVPPTMHSVAERGGGGVGDGTVGRPGEQPSNDGSDSLLAQLVGWASGMPKADASRPGQSAAADFGQASATDEDECEAEERTSGADGPELKAGKLVGFADDLDYLADHFAVVVARLKIYMIGMKEDADNQFEKQRPEARLRELSAQERTALRRCQERLSLTKDAIDCLRIERLRHLLGLSSFEVWVIITLIGGIISQDVRKIGSSSRFGQGTVSFEVGTLLGTHCPDDLKTQMMNRRTFYRQAPLLRNGVLRLADMRRMGSTGDLMDCPVEMDRRMLDFCVGLDTEFSELVDAAHLYKPDVSIDRVILPDHVKRLVLDTVESYSRFREYRKRVGLDDLINYGLGVVLLFHGPPGTGKTMFANALAHHLGKKLLLVTMPLFAENPPEAVRQVLREATLANALVFFDECDTLFQSRDRSKLVTFLLTELERFDGLLILATNRASELDEAMHRRITLALEFPPPDPFLREKIWKAHLPPELRVASDVDWVQLSMDYELSGGFIKNALVAALSFAVARSPEGCKDSEIEITGVDLHRACKLQVSSQLISSQLEQRLVPKRGLDALVLPSSSMVALHRVIDYERARRVLQGQWGFFDAAEFEGGTTVLFAGPRGTGKTLAAEAVAYELARPLRIMSCLEVLTTYRTSKQNAATLLVEARQSQAVLVLEGAEVLFGVGETRDRANASAADFLLFHVERAGGVVILCCTTSDGGSHQPKVPMHRMKFQVAFPRPGPELRATLWRKLLPEKAPLAADVDLKRLGTDFDLDGAAVKSAILRAAALAALRRIPQGEGGSDSGGLGGGISMADFEQARRRQAVGSA